MRANKYSITTVRSWLHAKDFDLDANIFSMLMRDEPIASSTKSQTEEWDAARVYLGAAASPNDWEGLHERVMVGKLKWSPRGYQLHDSGAKIRGFRFGMSGDERWACFTKAVLEVYAEGMLLCTTKEKQKRARRGLRLIKSSIMDRSHWVIYEWLDYLSFAAYGDPRVYKERDDLKSHKMVAERMLYELGRMKFDSQIQKLKSMSLM